jgi:hypothetical protein
MLMEILKYEEIPEIRRRLDNIGVATVTQNRTPMFEPSNKPKSATRTYEGKYGKYNKLTIEGRLGQTHKTLLETILWKKELYDYIYAEQISGDKIIKIKYLKVLYDREKIRKYLSQSKKYSWQGYEELLKDMMGTIITLEKEGERVRSPLVIDLYDSPTTKPTHSKSPIIPKETSLTTIVFGSVITTLIDTELKFIYDPKPIAQLNSGISQAIARFLKTHKSHPRAGYNLRQLVKHLGCPTEGTGWRNIKRAIKQDIEQLEAIGIAISLEKEKVFMINNKR